MIPLHRIPIRFQLIIIVLILAVPAAGIIVYSGVQHKTTAEKHARKDTQNLVDTVATEQRLFLASSQQLLVTLSELPEINEKDANATSVFLKRIHRLNPAFLSLVIADRHGRVWASSLPVQGTVNVSDRRYFRQALEQGRFASGEYQIGRITRQPTFHVSYPIWDDNGKAAGVIGLGMSLKRYSGVVNMAQVPRRTSLILLDHRGTVLFNSTAGGTATGQPFPPPLFQKMMSGADAATSTEAGIAGDSPQEEHYVSYRKLYLQGETSPYMYVWVGIPVESALEESNRELFGSMVTFAAVLIAALIAAGLIGESSIIAPISNLQAAAEDMANGNLRITVSDQVRGGELGMLAASFDKMAKELTRRQERLASSQRFLNTIIDTEPECLLMLDAEGRILMMNMAGLSMLEAETFDLVEGRSIFLMISEEYKASFRELLESIFSGTSGNLEFESIGLKGNHLWLDLHAVPFKNGSDKAVSALGIARDVTDRHQAQQVLLQREADLRKAQKIAKLGSWNYDLTSGILSWSEELYSIYGVAPGSFTPTVDSFIKLIHPEDRPAMLGWFDAYKTGNEPEGIEFRVPMPDGSTRFISGRGELVPDAAGAVGSIAGTAQDITERKVIEEALRQKKAELEELNTNLELRVAEAVSELRQKDQVLIQQSRQAAMGEMLGNIAHQWRQPLNTLGLILQEFQLTYGREELSKESIDTNVKKAMALIKHMSKTIDDFSSYFKPDQRQTLFNVNGAILNTLSLIEPSLEALNIRVEVTENDSVNVSGFNNEYAQVVLNLLFNSRDAFREKDPGEERRISITVSQEYGNSVVTIADNAGGIPPDIIGKIFDPYFTTKGPDKGTGIGLYMSKVIIEQHMHGRLGVRNIDGGVEFRIELPMSNEA